MKQNINKLAILGYYKKADAKQQIEFAPFVIKNDTYHYNKSENDNVKIFKSLFNNKLVSSILEPSSTQIETCMIITNDMGFYHSIPSTVVITNILYITEIILKMPEKEKLKFLRKKTLKLKDILSIYNFVLQNMNLFNLDINKNFYNNKEYIKKKQSVNY